MNSKIIEWINNAYFNDKVNNRFERFLEPTLEKIDNGFAVVSMKVLDRHLNLHKITHGGVLASLADLTMGLSCVSCMKRVVTTDMSISFINNVPKGSYIKAVARVDHNGSRMMRTTCEIFDEDGRLLVKTIGSFFVLGKLDENSFNEFLS